MAKKPMKSAKLGAAMKPKPITSSKRGPTPTATKPAKVPMSAKAQRAARLKDVAL